MATIDNDKKVLDKKVDVINNDDNDDATKKKVTTTKKKKSSSKKKKVAKPISKKTTKISIKETEGDITNKEKTTIKEVVNDDGSKIVTTTKETETIDKSYVDLDNDDAPNDVEDDIKADKEVVEEAKVDTKLDDVAESKDVEELKDSKANIEEVKEEEFASPTNDLNYVDKEQSPKEETHVNPHQDEIDLLNKQIEANKAKIKLEEDKYKRKKDLIRVILLFVLGFLLALITILLFRCGFSASVNPGVTSSSSTESSSSLTDEELINEINAYIDHIEDTKANHNPDLSLISYKLEYYSKDTTEEVHTEASQDLVNQSFLIKDLLTGENIYQADINEDNLADEKYIANQLTYGEGVYARYSYDDFNGNGDGYSMQIAFLRDLLSDMDKYSFTSYSYHNDGETYSLSMEGVLPSFGGYPLTSFSLTYDSYLISKISLLSESNSHQEYMAFSLI